MPRHRSESRDILFQYFDDEDQSQKKARCKLCRNRLSYKTTTGNLKIHLRVKHPTVMKRLEKQIALAQGEDVQTSEESEEEEFDDFAAKQQKLAEDFHESDSEKNCYTEIVYLESGDETKEFKQVLSEPKSPISHKRNKRKSTTIAPPTPAVTAPLTPATTVNDKESEKDEEIENFGRYIIGLLKKVPEKMCSKLQLDIVNLIMTAKMRMKTLDAEQHFIITNENGNLVLNPASDNNSINLNTSRTCVANEENDIPELVDKSRYTEVVYQEDIDDTGENKTTKRKLPINFKRIKLKQSSTLVYTEADKNEEIDNFGRYVIGLVKRLPSEVHTKLQMDIINLIMTTKLKPPDAQNGGSPFIVNFPDVPTNCGSNAVNPTCDMEVTC